MSLPFSAVSSFPVAFVWCRGARGAAPAGRGVEGVELPCVEPGVGRESSFIWWTASQQWQWNGGGSRTIPGRRRRCPSPAVEAVRGGGESTLVGEHRLAETEPSDAGLLSCTRRHSGGNPKFVRPFLSQRPYPPKPSQADDARGVEDPGMGILL